MKLLQNLLILVLVAVLAACNGADEGGGQTATSQPDTEAGPDQSQAPAATASAPIRYRAYDPRDFDSAEKLTATCESEEAAMREQFAALETFEGEPSLEGYLEAVNSLASSLGNLSSISSSLGGIHPDAAIREAGETCARSLASLGTDLSLSRPIFEAVSALDVSGADAETQHAVEKQLLSYRLSGVDKDEPTREKIRALNAEIVEIGQTFDRNIREAVHYLELESVDDLAGLPQDYIDAHPANEEGKIRISTQYPDLFPFMTYAERDDLRKQLRYLNYTRAYPENREALEQLMAKRYELAQLIGYDNWAQLVTADKMVGSPDRVAEFLEELKGYTTEANESEYQILLERLRQEQPDAQRLEPWQWGYIAEKVKQEQFEVDSKVIREYFPYGQTRDGILTLVQDLFQVEIRPWDTPVWHEAVGAYELVEDGEVIGRFYLDMHPREGKYQHAAMFPMTLGIEGQYMPVATLVCNFPAGDELMQHNQVVTFLHEFGHLIHWLFAGHHRWANVSGINTEWDFVEAPSQMLQEWVWDYDTIASFAVNSDGETLPKELLDKMIAARDFGLGMGTRRQLSLAALSLNLYNQNPANVDVEDLTREMVSEYTHFEPMEGTHFYAVFGHLNGYSAIYYTYQWSLAIATDMFTRFEDEGLRNKETSASYRDTVLAAGGAKPAAELVTEFLGREISFKPYADRLSGVSRGTDESGE